MAPELPPEHLTAEVLTCGFCGEQVLTTCNVEHVQIGWLPLAAVSFELVSPHNCAVWFGEDGRIHRETNGKKFVRDRGSRVWEPLPEAPDQ